MWKELLVVGAAAAAGEWFVQKYGAQIQAQTSKLGLPAMAGHILVVGGSAAGGYALLKAFL